MRSQVSTILLARLYTVVIEKTISILVIITEVPRVSFLAMSIVIYLVWKAVEGQIDLGVVMHESENSQGNVLNRQRG